MSELEVGVGAPEPDVDPILVVSSENVYVGSSVGASVV